MLKDPDWYPLTLGLNAWNAQAATAGGEAIFNLVITGVAADDRAADRRLPASCSATGSPASRPAPSRSEGPAPAHRAPARPLAIRLTHRRLGRNHHVPLDPHATAMAPAPPLVAGAALAGALRARRSTACSGGRHRRRRPGRRRGRAASSPVWAWDPPSSPGRRRVLRGQAPQRRRSSSSTPAPATTSTPRCRTRSPPAPACPTSRRSSTTRCRSSPSPSRSPTSPSSAPARPRRHVHPRPVERGPARARASTACRSTPARWRCSTTRTVFDEVRHRRSPTTWDEYVEAARALHEADPNVYITNDTGDAGFTTRMIWQAGGKPYTVDGTDVTIDFADEGSTKFAEHVAAAHRRGAARAHRARGATSGTRAWATAPSPP